MQCIIQGDLLEPQYAKTGECGALVTKHCSSLNILLHNSSDKYISIFPPILCYQYKNRHCLNRKGEPMPYAKRHFWKRALLSGRAGSRDIGNKTGSLHHIGFAEKQQQKWFCHLVRMKPDQI